MAPAVLELLPRAADGLSRIDAARLEFAIRHEMALRARDFLEVSTTIGLEGRPEAVNAVTKRFSTI